MLSITAAEPFAALRLQRYNFFLNCTNLFCIFSDFRPKKNKHVYRDKNLPFAFHLRCVLDPFTSESRIPPHLIYTMYISRDFRNSSFLPYTTKNDIHLRICHFSCKPINLRLGELVFADTADGANPISREFFKRFAFFAGVVLVPADITNVLCHNNTNLEVNKFRFGCKSTTIFRIMQI